MSIHTPRELREAVETGNVVSISAQTAAGVIRQANADGVVSYSEVNDARQALNSFREQLGGQSGRSLLATARDLEERAQRLSTGTPRERQEAHEMRYLARQCRAGAATEQRLAQILESLENTRAEQSPLTYAFIDTFRDLF